LQDDVAASDAVEKADSGRGQSLSLRIFRI
jgi:hypothetical protein